VRDFADRVKTLEANNTYKYRDIFRGPFSPQGIDHERAPALRATISAKIDAGAGSSCGLQES
jgi:hypothetical protein